MAGAEVLCRPAEVGLDLRWIMQDALEHACAFESAATARLKGGGPGLRVSLLAAAALCWERGVWQASRCWASRLRLGFDG